MSADMASSSNGVCSVPPDYHTVATLRSTQDQMRKCISIDLLTACQREVNFLRMIDRKAPVLYEKGVVENAIRRYECFWLPMQAAKPDLNNIPPLDVHWIWHTHMLSPTHYQQDCMAICGTVVDHKLLSSDEIQQRYEQSVSTWNNFCPDEPYDFLNSNSTPPSIPYKQKSSYDIAGAVQRQRNFNYQVSLPHFTAPRFLKDAIDRYLNFLLLKQTYTNEFLTPCYDFDLVWHTHQVHPQAYSTDCTAIFGSLLKHDDSVNDRTKNSKLLKGESITKKLWSTHFKEGFWRRGCMYRGHVAPVFLGFENQDISNITYGHIHIPSISLKEIPVQREQLRLKLSYGNKKITTFNADLYDKQVTRSSFSLVWQPSCVENHQSTSIVKFPFEKKCPKELIVELELYDKVFLQKKDIIRLQGKLLLEQLLPPANAKTAQNVMQMYLENIDRDRDLRAKVNVTTSISLNRELELIAGDYVEQALEPDSRLWTLCQSSALNRSALQPGATAFVATHTLVDVRDGAKYIVQVVHSASMLLSMILVYGTEQRLLCMAHLIGADSLPSKDQLDSNLQFLPHLSSPEERVFIVLNRDGDFAIVKGRWNGFTRKISGDKSRKGKPGAAGVLNVELFNLLRNTVQKLQLPGADGSTLFLIGDAQARLNGRRLHCRSTQTAEHIACIFAIGTLFVLCNPDKVRSRADTSPVGHQCQKWPMTLACGYGRPIPSNRFLAHRDGGFDFTPAILAMCGGLCDGAGGCGACGSCGGCGGGCGGCGGCG